MKKTKSGFMLVETLIVAVFVLTTLVYLFIQFQRIDNSYRVTFTYNTTDSLYRVNNVKKYILKNGFTALSTALDNGIDQYIDITNCPATYLVNTTFCTELFESIGVVKVLFANEDLTLLNNDLDNLYFISENMKNYIKYIDFDSEVGKYRLIIEFDNGQFGTLKIF